MALATYLSRASNQSLGIVALLGRDESKWCRQSALPLASALARISVLVFMYTWASSDLGCTQSSAIRSRDCVMQVYNVE